MKTVKPSNEAIEQKEAERGSWKLPARRYGLVAGTYVLATLVTAPFFMGDTIGYADYIVRRDFSDFGHFGWYLLGWLASELMMPLTRLFVGQAPTLNVTLTLIIINWLAGLMSVLLMRSLTSHITRREWAANLATLALIVSLAFLDLTQSGSSYIPGMSLLLLAIHIQVTRNDDPRSVKRSILAGLSLAGALAVWFTYIFAIPAAIAAPMILHGFNKQRIRFALQTGATITVVTMLLFGIGSYTQGVRTVTGLREWVSRAAHGAHGISGFARAAFGAGHSFIDTGNDGPMVKAYLTKDQYNPVSLTDLVRASLWKLALFYLFLSAVFFNLLRSAQGRRIFVLFAATAVPVVGFAIFWQGGAIERYLLLYPVLFVALAYSLASDRSIRVLKYVCLTFVATMAVSNLMVLAKPVQARREQAVIRRLKELQPLLKRQSLVVTLNQTDEVWALQWTFPFNPINASESLNTYHLIEPLTDQVLSWREDFASEVLSVWEDGGDAWISTRMLSERPLRDWNWIERADPNVSWKDINAFFSRIQTGNVVGGEDGFWLLLPSEQNRSLLKRIVQETSVQPGAAPSSSARRRTQQ
ncbi:MAG TPA: hypothetical protein VKF81_17060 [Blastocatellia bacterium]|nr:hypothetical protein [Blastocatellia bacterium]